MKSLYVAVAVVCLLVLFVQTQGTTLEDDFVAKLTKRLTKMFKKRSNECPLQPGKEYPAEHEDEEIAKIAADVVLTLNETYTQKKQFVRRDAHPKSHGCVKAYFKVDADIPVEFRYGIFANTSSTYKAWIRFSNGNPGFKSDYFPDSRGMAVKLMGVRGNKLLPDEADATTQDFVGANRPAFFLSSISDYLAFFVNVRRGGWDLLKWLISESKFREMNAARKFVLTTIGNPLLVQYFSATPYKLGPNAVKYSWQPVDCKTRAPLSDRLPGLSENFLRERMTESLKQHDSCFDFLVQKQFDACEQPIEDPIKEWTTPLIKIGSLTIFKQEFDTTDAEKLYCEDLSFTPWHSLEDHRPLGNMNRARKVVYQATSTYRHKINKQPRVEPTSW